MPRSSPVAGVGAAAALGAVMLCDGSLREIAGAQATSQGTQACRRRGCSDRSRRGLCVRALAALIGGMQQLRD